MITGEHENSSVSNHRESVTPNSETIRKKRRFVKGKGWPQSTQNLGHVEFHERFHGADLRTKETSSIWRSNGTIRNYKTAFPIILRAARSGDPVYQNLAGYCYEYGYGVEADLLKAKRWYSRAAKSGSTIAMGNLALFYETAKGVRLSYVTALRWYRKAAQQGCVWCQTNLGSMYARGTGTPVDMKAALMWWHKAAYQNDREAAHNLGIAFSNGVGVAKNLAKGRYWMKRASAKR